MLRLLPLVGLLAVLASATSAQVAGDTSLDLKPRYLADTAPAPDRPIMYGLDKIGVAKTLKDLGITIQGHVEASYTFNFDAPRDRFPENAGRVFDVDNKDVVLNQLDLTVVRAVDPKKLDLGGTMEWIYGRDARFIHANGLFDYHNDDVHPPPNQWDLTQAYITINVPVGNGLTIDVGKWATLLGHETINPFGWSGPSTFSHSYLFGYAIPFTHTGIKATYTMGEFTLVGGISRGWEQATEDNNGSLDGIGSIKWARGEWVALLNFTVGPEQAGDNKHWRTVLDVMVQYNPDKSPWSFALNGDYGYDSGAAADGSAAQWYGVAGYAGYTICDAVKLTGRAEWFRDDDGTRIGVRGNFYEVTLGASIKPMPKDPLGQNVQIRPEIRWDHSNTDFFDGGSKKNQFTAAVEVLIAL